MVNHKTNILQKHGWVEIKPSNVTLKHLDSVISLNHSINLEIMDKFPKLDLLQNEFIEASKTSILRYSNQSKNFVKSMIVDLLKDHSYLSEYFITPPYIITHPAIELREEGTYHGDTVKYCGKSYTSWTPINNYQLRYPPLSLFSKSHLYFYKIIFKLVNKFKQSKNIDKIFKFLLLDQIDLNVKNGNTYLWHSDLIHKGNRNYTEKSHAALVTRISEKPLYYEPTEKISELVKNDHLRPVDEKISLQDVYLKIKDIYEITKHNSDLIKFSEDLRRKTASKFYLKHISFSLSVLALRLNNDSSSNLDMISFILSKENLVSLERFLNKFKNNDISNKILECFFDDENLSYQETLVIKKFKNQDLDNLEGKKNILWKDN